MNVTREWLLQLPKAELHVHLEGTVSPARYRQIAQRNGVTLPAQVEMLFHCSDFESFLQAFIGVVKTLREPADFSDLVSDYLQTSVEHGVRHVEFFFSPATVRHFHKRADLPGILQAIHAAAEQAQRRAGISSLLIFDMVRNLGEEEALADIDLAHQYSAHGVVGVGLGGDERKFPARDFYKPFERAAKLGLRRTVHAGEAASSQSVIDAIEILGAERIGHGVAAAEEEALLHSIAQRGIGIDSCIASTRVTGAWRESGAHPLKVFLAKGINVTLSSDDPAFFNTSLLDEYARAVDLGLTKQDVVTLARNSFQMSFASEGDKSAWNAELEAFIARE